MRMANLIVAKFRGCPEWKGTVARAPFILTETWSTQTSSRYERC